MATVVWRGGATAVAQVDTLTPGGTIEATDVFTVTLADESGSTASVNATAGGTAVADVCAAVQAACAASDDPRFAAVLFVNTGTTVTVTARVAGVPFYCSVATTETGGGAADAQTFGRASTTANAGPHDWDTAANWSTATVPTAGDDVIIADSGYSILHGLRQSGTLDSIRRAASFRGDVGDRIAGVPLDIDATTVTIQGGGGVFRLQATCTTCYIEGTSAEAEAVVLGGTLTNLYVSGTGVRGEIVLRANTSLTNLDMHDVAATARISVLDGNTAPTSVRIGAGRMDFAGGTITTLRQAGGYVALLEDSAATTVEVYQGTLDDRTSGTITTLTNMGGTVTLANSTAASHTITTLHQLAGVTDLRSGLANVTITNNPTVRGGTLRTDVGRTIDPAA